MFVKWSCGCKGIQLENSNWIIYSCDGEGELSLYKREMTDCAASSLRRDEYESLSDEDKGEPIPKSFQELPQEEVEELLSKMGKIMSQGHAYSALRSELKFMMRD